jgi:ribosomal protein S18 acetylase RimI-like enzyme
MHSIARPASGRHGRTLPTIRVRPHSTPDCVLRHPPHAHLIHHAPMNAVHIRLATPADVDAIAPLFDAYRQFYEQAPDRAGARAFIAQRLEREESVVLLALDASGAAIGFCQLYPAFCSVEAAPIYTLYDLFVEPGARKTGAGRSLMIAAEATARADGKARMDLTTAHTNTAAQSLYESLGWVQDTVFRAYTRRIAG